jgi:hypothetical protein
MQTLKEVLSRQEERQNLRNAGLCVLLILALVLVSFGVTQVHLFPHRRVVENSGELVSREPSTYP